MLHKIIEKKGIFSSAEAKGRIERHWQTMQDRMVPEMRLRKIKVLTRPDKSNGSINTWTRVVDARFETFHAPVSEWEFVKAL